MKSDFSEFTESKYRELLRLMSAHWKPIGFDELKRMERVCLWRHDIDASIQRSLKLAQIEAAEGVKATYFVHLHNMFYNALEKPNVAALMKIAKLGHAIGLHFDAGFYAALSRAPDLPECLALEKQVLERVLDVPVTTFSLHDPEPDVLTADEVAGMVNAYGAGIRERFSYVSDSNGYWRFRDLREVLQARQEERLHVLTHPEWWTEEPMSPRNRISRCIDGRSAAVSAAYDAELERSGRSNIR